MKGMWSYFSDGFDNGHVFHKQIYKTQKVNRYCEAVNQFFAGHPIRRAGYATGEW
jgi:hypothetical protein